jgi:uncharacterized protein
MKTKLLISLLCAILISVFCFAQIKKSSTDIEQWQTKINKEYSTRTTSPLRSGDFKNFVTLPFFDNNSSLRVVATLKMSSSKEEIPFKTTTTSVQIYTKYADAVFNLKGMKYQLSLYQSKDLLDSKEFADYLFLPFTDSTNGVETYTGGRYIDLKLPKNKKTIIIDFNKAYNPYCAYNTMFSCPKVPAENNLPLKIEAGVKYTTSH